MLRIDVDVADAHPNGYVVPADNPFVGGTLPGAAGDLGFGLRNPWRYSFDDPALGGTGALVIGDVGQNALGRDRLRAARRAAAATMAGATAKARTPNVAAPPPPAFQPLIDPIHEYDRSQGAVGHRRLRLPRARRSAPHIAGRYFFADYVSGRVWSMGLDDRRRTARPRPPG